MSGAKGVLTGVVIQRGKATVTIELPGSEWKRISHTLGGAVYVSEEHAGAPSKAPTPPAHGAPKPIAEPKGPKAAPGKSEKAQEAGMAAATTPGTSRMLRVATVAELLDLPEKRVYELVRAGVLPHVRLGRSIRFNSAELEAWMAAGGASYEEGEDE